MLTINASVQMLVADAVTTVHAGDVAVAEDARYYKLKLIGLTLGVEDVATEDAVHRMTFVLEEERIYS